MLKNPKSMFLM